MRVAKEGCFYLLCKGKVIDLEKCVDAWEQIVKRNAIDDYTSYMDLLQGFANLLADYNVIKASLLKLMIGGVDDATIQYLQTKGYSINTESMRGYVKSIESSLRKSDNIITKINMRRNELTLLSKERNGNKETNFEEALANVSAGLGFSIPEDVTLARFNEYCKIIKKKHERVKERRHNQ